jgi:hypothetical protein
MYGPPAHLLRDITATSKPAMCDTCPHGEHGAPCRGHDCMCRGPWADVPDAWLPIKADLEDTA